jgi:hypothetical protein
MQVEGYMSSDIETGARVRNAYAIYLLQGNSPEKFGLMPHSIMIRHLIIIKVTTAKDEHASH